MNFPFNQFSDLLTEFQKYLTTRISRPVYWALGLVVVTLGILIGSIVGWSTVLDSWNRTDATYKLFLGGAAAVTFLLLAYLLGSLQGTVERWFQGDRLISWGKLTGQLGKHQALWEKHSNAFQQMVDVYAAIRQDWNDLTQWGRFSDASQQVLQTRRALPRYAIIADTDLEITTTATAPAQALHDLQASIGMMVQHPLDAGAIITDADLLRLPPELDQPVIMALSVPVLIVPTGLIPGDRIIIYAREQSQAHVTALHAALVVAIDQLALNTDNGSQGDLVHLTLAIGSGDIDSFIGLSNEYVQSLVRLASPPVHSAPAALPTGQPLTLVEPDAQDLPTDTRITEQINMLAQQYTAGQQWFKDLREGTWEPQIPLHIDALKDSFRLIKNGATAASPEQTEKWFSQVNTYRNDWIHILEDASEMMQYRIDQHYRTLYLYYPASREKITATPIGNVFRAVDSYCEQLYGLDLALVLPRMQTVMDKQTRNQLTKAHDHLALLEWFYLSSITIGLVGTILAFLHQFYWLALLLWLLVLPVPQFILYPAAFAAAIDYAAALRLAVDCERGKVITQAGFSLPSPMSQEQEKELWKQIQQWWIYGTPPGDYTLKGSSSEQST